MIFMFFEIKKIMNFKLYIRGIMEVMDWFNLNNFYMPNIEYELNEKIHAIIINPYLTWEDFCTNCDLIKKYNIKNISTSLNYLTDLKNSLGN